MTRGSKLIWLQDVETERPWLSVRYMERLVGERRINFYRVGRRIFFDPADLDAIPIKVPQLVGV